MIRVLSQDNDTVEVGPMLVLNPRVVEAAVAGLTLANGARRELRPLGVAGFGLLLSATLWLVRSIGAMERVAAARPVPTGT